MLKWECGPPSTYIVIQILRFGAWGWGRGGLGRIECQFLKPMPGSSLGINASKFYRWVSLQRVTICAWSSLQRVQAMAQTCREFETAKIWEVWGRFKRKMLNFVNVFLKWIETLGCFFAAMMNLVCRKSYQILLSYTGGGIKLKLSLSPMAMKTTLVLFHG